MSKFARNKPCWCGSGKKYKWCHYPHKPDDKQPNGRRSDAFDLVFREAEVQERLREMQQGKGRPIISAEVAGHQMVATGNTVHFSKKWKTFPDFLFEYVWQVVGKEWATEEMKRAEADAHQLVSWHRAFLQLQKRSRLDKNGLYSAEMTGATTCLLGLSYSLYLIKHNVELQELLVTRLKDQKQFQGAYYELIVANCLIRAGFQLELEDETDASSKHCEFAAISPDTDERFWVEAKMRSVDGLLGKTSVDGSRDPNPTSQLSKHVSAALKKPALGKRLIFVDVNAPAENGDSEPSWCPSAYDRLSDRERNLGAGQEAYIFVTNFPYHRALDDTRIPKAVLAFGLGIPDFAKVGPTTLTDAYKSKLQHADAYSVMESIRCYPHLPDTFDGKPIEDAPSEKLSPRLRVGNKYHFEESGSNGTLGILRQVLVHENTARSTLLVETDSGQTVILEGTLATEEIAAYKKYGGAYFGELSERNGKTGDEFELFEFFVKSYKETPRERLLEFVAEHPHIEQLRQLDHEALVYAICESCVLSTLGVEGKKK